MEKFPQRHYKLFVSESTQATKESKKGSFEQKSVSSETKTVADNSSRRNRTIFTLEQLQRLEEEFYREKYVSRQKRCELAIKLNLPENTIKVWFQNRRMKLKRERISISWPYSYDPQTQAFLTPVAASYTYPWMQPTTVSASANSLFPLPSQLCFAASTSNHSSLSASSISSSSSMKNHICRLWQSSATNDSGMYPRLAAVATTPKIQYGNNSEVDKISTTNFKRSNLSTINNGITSSFVDVQAMYFSQLQKYTQRRDLHHYPHEQQTGYKAFLAYDPFFSNGLSTLTQSFSSQSNYNTMMSSYPVCSLYDNARGVETE